MLKRVNNSKDSQPDVAAFALVKREIDALTSVVAVEGELDLSTAPRLKWMLVDSLEAGGSQLVVDLSLTTFMDSTALGVLVAVNRRPDLDGPLAIVCPKENVRQIFEFSGTDAAFAICPTVEDALDRIQGRTAPAG
jgi:anti-sigma B factor antagonist